MSQPNPKHILPFVTPSAPKIPPDQRACKPLTEVAAGLVQQGIQTARAGQRNQAFALFDQAAQMDPHNVQAWLWCGGLADDPRQSILFLEKALELDSGNRQAIEGLAWARQRLTSLHDVGPSAPSVVPPHRERAAAPPPIVPAPPVAPVVDEEPTPPRLSVTPRSERAAPAATRSSDSIVSRLAAGLTYLTMHPTVALVIAVLLLGVLGTAAVARAGMSRDDDKTTTGGPTIVSDFADSAALASAGAAPTVVVSNAGALPVATVGRASPTPGRASPTPAPGKTPLPAPSPAVVISTNPELTLDQAWAAEDWQRAIAILSEALTRAPGDAALTKKLFSAHFNFGVKLVRADRLQEAIEQFDEALKIDPTSKSADGERKFAKYYLYGINAFENGEYGNAISAFQSIYDGNPGYRQVKPKLIEALMASGANFEKTGKPLEAYERYDQTRLIDPSNQAAQAGAERVRAAAGVPLSASNKRIDVNLLKQRVTVYENDKVKWTFVASTGKDPYITRTGNFRIRSKMPESYSSALGWRQPMWMGIYMAGGTENGFHALAIDSKGKKLPDSVLGRPATTGCVMLSDADAKALYDWADIGVMVTIHY